MAATESNSFIEPPPQSHPGDYSFASLIEYGSPQEFRWTSNYKIPLDLSLIQETHFLDDNTLPIQAQILASNLTNTSYSWNGEPSQNISLSNLFWLAMYNASNDGSGGPLFKSQYFNVTSSTTSSSTTTSSSSSTTSSSLSSSTPPAQAITTPISTTPSASPTPSGTPKSATNKVALGAGLGVGLGGAALIIVLSVFFFLGRKRHGRNRKSAAPEVYQLADNGNFSR